MSASGCLPRPRWSHRGSLGAVQSMPCWPLESPLGTMTVTEVGGLALTFDETMIKQSTPLAIRLVPDPAIDKKNAHFFNEWGLTNGSRRQDHFGNLHRVPCRVRGAQPRGHHTAPDCPPHGCPGARHESYRLGKADRLHGGVVIASRAGHGSTRGHGEPRLAVLGDRAQVHARGEGKSREVVHVLGFQKRKSQGTLRRPGGMGARARVLVK